MGTRIISALLGIPLLVFVLLRGGTLITVALTVVTLVALGEFYSVFKNVGIRPFYAVGMVSSTVITITSGVYEGRASVYIISILAACVIACFIAMILQNKSRLNDLGITLLGLVYISVLMSMLLTLYFIDKGRTFIWLVFIVAWVGDTFAYFIGISIGKRRLCPGISPKKSVEGSIGGLAGSILGALVFGYMGLSFFDMDYELTGLAVVGLVGGIMAQLGDLTASIIKRHAGVKDYGNIMPGHGGILDRFDSVLFVIPVIYYYIRVFY